MAEEPFPQVIVRLSPRPEMPSSDTTAGASTSAGTAPPIDRANGAPSAPVSQLRKYDPSSRFLGAFHLWTYEAVRQTPSWLVSMAFHMTMLVVLALWGLPLATTGELRQLVVTPTGADLADLERLDDKPIEDVKVEAAGPEVVNLTADVKPVEPTVGVLGDTDAVATKLDSSGIGVDKTPKNDLLVNLGRPGGGALSGRGPAGRAAMVAKAGGSEASERAVAMGLRWLASVQCPDGGWSFNHTVAPGGDQSRNPGTLAVARNAATGLALLPFLGAGQTHKTGQYRRTVQAGLYYLVNHMQVEQNRGSWHEIGGTMYSHGIASIAMCEAYAMTGDKGLQGPAQEAINFICYAQDPLGGGWRYHPQQPGDTSMVGWQLMALKSGYMSYLVVPPLVTKKASLFLDSVQEDSGSRYGYTGPQLATGATTAIGLLCRMQLGWQRDNSALERGVQWLSAKGPSKTNMYYDYYATQVMRHYEGPMWEKWNALMRDYLVDTQATVGHEKGSWFFPHGDSVDVGGRLYCTSMATMILEVYYRYLPIYGKQSTEATFPID